VREDALGVDDVAQELDLRVTKVTFPDIGVKLVISEAL